MPRFHFEVRYRGDVISDVDGMECIGLAEAMHEAEHAARDLLARAIIADRDPPLKIVVLDDHQQNMATIDLKMLIPIVLR